MSKTKLTIEIEIEDADDNVSNVQTSAYVNGEKLTCITKLGVLASASDQCSGPFMPAILYEQVDHPDLDAALRSKLARQCELLEPFLVRQPDNVGDHFVDEIEGVDY